MPQTAVGKSVSSFCRDVKIRGGVAIYVANHVNAVPLSDNLLNLSEELHFEAAGVNVNDLQLISLYRSLDGNFEYFIMKLCRLLDGLDYRKQIVLTGDFNVRFNTLQHQAQELVNLFSCYGFMPIVSQNTRTQVV
ncbi:unnamed protein product [Acanthoscelides obtectus]|uniref:Endonuclease/exonuclease/phosphatase domain-containing protein n=1 Tax=Acanthoscelides obtectus TaxID=200917 RepID=A0A9P0QAF4_ACAOB|nr:unnamed protein product [Acanthoscelides obtectus]CAK1659533.1 hypothetical protein AOBTE_LOCUS21511 [Acanthoscelides obtectus]